MKIFIIVLACFAGGGLSAQQFLGSTRMVTLAMPATNTTAPLAGPNAPVPSIVYPVASNDMVEIKTITANGPGTLAQGSLAQISLNHSSGTTAYTTTNGTFYTGLNSITLKQPYSFSQANGNITYNYFPVLATFTVTSPSNPNAIPANSVVIPSDSSGPVNVILESSADLVNWNPALPGTYGTTSTNRFFRVRAERTP